jgi:hypothetical protein
MPQAYINGFPTEDDGTIVRAHDGATFGTSEAKLLFEGKPGKDGLIRFDLSRSLVGKKLQLTAIGGRSKYIGTTLPISRLGVFHTVFLQVDRALGHTEQDMNLPSNWFVESQKVIAGLYREAKYKNYLLTAFFSVATIASPFIGIYIEGFPGIAAGAFLSIGSLLLGNYASGFSHGL